VRPKRAFKKPHRHAVGSSVMDGNGHPTALTPERHARLIAELEVGDWPAMAAIRADCAPRTVVSWLERGLEPGAVEPYATFALEFVKVEARLCGQLTSVVMDAALGRGKPKKASRNQDPIWAFKLLESRFRFLWRVDERGNMGGTSVTELVLAAVDKMDASRADKARALLKQLPELAKQEARKEGFQL
jgi:hypothetical protein